jgi:hypothetical protein
MAEANEVSRRERMAGRDRQGNPPKDDGKPKKPPPPKTDDDDDFEDGDFATPKRDRNGDDDEPLE